MTPQFLLDANVLSEPLRPDPDPGVIGKLQSLHARVCTAAPVWSELRFGCNRLPASRRRVQIEHYLQSVLAPDLLILPFDAAAAELHGIEKARLAGIGRVPTLVDGMIAAIAVVHDTVLVTANTKDFMEFENLRVEDWRSRR